MKIDSTSRDGDDLLSATWELDPEPEKTHPQRGGDCWVKVIARIRRNATGEIREYPTIAILEKGADAPSDFIWSDGNYSCDCNRALFFLRAKGEDDSDDQPCGDDAYSVQVLNSKTGAPYYDELDEASR